MPESMEMAIPASIAAAEWKAASLAMAASDQR
jgi:hypothetical protein